MPSKRSHGEGTLRHRSDGRWELRMMDGYQKDGSPRFKTFYGKTQKEVKLCSDCQEVVEKLDRDVLGGEKELYDLHMIQLQKRAKNPSEAFLSWKTAHFPVE